MVHDGPGLDSRFSNLDSFQKSMNQLIIYGPQPLKQTQGIPKNSEI
jgi:hypothetical protein